MPDDFRVPADINARLSTRRLLRSLGPSGFAAWVFVQARIRSDAADGDTSAWSADDWATAGEWSGDPRQLIDGLVGAGLVAAVGGGWVPLNWSREQPHAVHAEQRSRAASKAAQARWNRYLVPDASEAHADRNAPLRSNPIPSGPLQSSPVSVIATAGGAPSALSPVVGAQAELALTGETTPSQSPYHAAVWPEGIRRIAVVLGTSLADLERVRPTDHDALKRWHSTHDALLQFDDPIFWSSIDEWLGGEDAKVFYLDEWRKFWSWFVSQPLSRRRRAMQATFRNWLSKCEFWRDRDAQREATRERERPGSRKRGSFR